MQCNIIILNYLDLKYFIVLLYITNVEVNIRKNLKSLFESDWEIRSLRWERFLVQNSFSLKLVVVIAMIFIHSFPKMGSIYGLSISFNLKYLQAFSLFSYIFIFYLWFISPFLQYIYIHIYVYIYIYAYIEKGLLLIILPFICLFSI